MTGICDYNDTCIKSPCTTCTGYQRKPMDIKDTKGKLNYSQMQWEGIEAVAKVFQYAEKKYGNVSTWRNLTPASKDRYLNALMRHLVEIFKGNRVDPESGLPHIYAVAWNALTSAYIDTKDDTRYKENL